MIVGIFTVGAVIHLRKGISHPFISDKHPYVILEAKERKENEYYVHDFVLVPLQDFKNTFNDPDMRRALGNFINSKRMTHAIKVCQSNQWWTDNIRIHHEAPPYRIETTTFYRIQQLKPKIVAEWQL